MSYQIAGRITAVADQPSPDSKPTLIELYADPQSLAKNPIYCLWISRKPYPEVAALARTCKLGPFPHSEAGAI